VSPSPDASSAAASAENLLDYFFFGACPGTWPGLMTGMFPVSGAGFTNPGSLTSGGCSTPPHSSSFFVIEPVLSSSRDGY
jgi:hypothetical protein